MKQRQRCCRLKELRSNTDERDNVEQIARVTVNALSVVQWMVVTFTSVRLGVLCSQVGAWSIVQLVVVTLTSSRAVACRDTEHCTGEPCIN